jgi:hypothetical protein
VVSPRDEAIGLFGLLEIDVLVEVMRPKMEAIAHLRGETIAPSAIIPSSLAPRLPSAHNDPARARSDRAPAFSDERFHETLLRVAEPLARFD